MHNEEFEPLMKHHCSKLQYPRPGGTEVVLTKSSIVHAAWTKLQVPATRTTPSPWSISLYLPQLFILEAAMQNLDMILGHFVKLILS